MTKILVIIVSLYSMEIAKGESREPFGSDYFFPDIIKVFEDLSYKKVSDLDSVIDLSKIRNDYAKSDSGDYIYREVEISKLKDEANLIYSYFYSMNKKYSLIISKMTNDKEISYEYVRSSMLVEKIIFLETQPLENVVMKFLFPIGDEQDPQNTMVFQVDLQIENNETLRVYLGLDDAAKIVASDINLKVFGALLK